MTDFISNIFTHMIDNAEKLGRLSIAASLWFFILVLLSFIAWKMRSEKQAAESVYAMRIKESETYGLVAKAIEKMADQVKELRFKIKCIGDD